MKKRGIILLSTILFLASCSQNDTNTSASYTVPEKKENFYAEAVLARQGALREELVFNTTAKGIREAIVQSRIQGRLQENKMRLGEFYEAGDPLIIMDNRIPELSSLQAEQQYRNAVLDYNAVKRLFEKGQAAESQLILSEATLKGAEAQWENSLLQLDNTEVTAPFSGFISEISGDLLAGDPVSPGQSLSRMVDLSSLSFEFSVGEDEIALISQNMDAEILIPSTQLTLKGKITAVSPGSDPKTGGFRVRVEAENNYDSILSGMSARITISLNERDTGIVVPSQALLEQGTRLLVNNNNRAELREIELKGILGDKALVSGQISANEEVIISGLPRLKEGDPVISSITGSI